MQLQTGSIFHDRYEILETLGTGGSGSVYKAKQIDADRLIALKLLHGINLDEEENRKRFHREAKALSRLQHKNIVSFYHFGFGDGGVPFAAMEYLRGKSLASILEVEGQLSSARSIQIMRQVCEALAFAHSLGIIHRDMKPGNIMLLSAPEPDTVKIIDFGLAKLTQKTGIETGKLTKTGLLIGSIHYMSPEQARGMPADARSDVYACGCILYEMLTGQKPFDSDNPVGLLYKHCNEFPPAFAQTEFARDCSVQLESICLKALEKNPDDRFQSMNEFVQSFDSQLPQSISKRTQATATPVSIEDRVPQFRSIAVLAFTVLVVGGGIFMLMPKSASDKGSNTDGIKQPLIRVPHQCKGIVYYLAVKAVSPRGPESPLHITEVHLQTQTGLVRLTCDLLPKSPLDLQIGKEWEGTYKGDDRSGLMDSYASTGKDTGDVSDANNVVQNYFDLLADKRYDVVFDALTDNFVKKQFPKLTSEQALKKVVESFKKESFQNYGNPTGKFPDDSNTPPLTMPTGEKLPPAQATKVQDAKPDLIRIIVDTSLFYSKPHGYECFSLKACASDRMLLLGDYKVKRENFCWKIDSIEPVDQAVWDSL